MLILPPEFSQRIVFISYLMLVSMSVAFLYELYSCCCCAFSVFLSSQMYWRHPVKGLRRNLDIFISISSLAYHVFLSFWSSAQGLYLLCVFMGVGCYLSARQTKSKDTSSLLHCLLHFFGNVSNVVLYTTYRR